MFELGPKVKVAPVAQHARTLGELVRLRMERSAHRPAHFEKRGDSWQPITWQQFFDRASRVAAGLLALGLSPGDRVAILGPTQPQWGAYDIGGQLAGMVTFGIYPKLAVDQVRYLIEHSEAKVIFVDEVTELATVIAAAKGIASLIAIVPWREADVAAGAAEDPRVISPARFEGELLAAERCKAIQDAIDPASPAILVYTSGTTGHPKGAMVSHRNILAMVSCVVGAFESYANDISLHFLPMAHAAERVAFFGRINTGVAGAYAKSIATVLDDLQSVQPTLFGSVPRIYEKAYAKIHSEISKQKPAVQKLFAWAVRVGRDRLALTLANKPVPLGLALQHRLADRLVFRKVRAAFGGRVRQMITGAAPTPLPVLEFFWMAGLPIYEVYGMTEATLMTHMNRPGHVKLGTVGRIVSSLEHKVADDGEILIRGPLVFIGYYKDAAATAEAVRDGWLHTGDVGTIDADGYVRITDRKKHLIITAGGKNLSPANIERAIMEQDPLIARVHAHGDRRSYVTAIVAPSPLETLEWGVARGLCTAEEVAQREAELLANPAGRTPALEMAIAKIVVDAEFRERIRDAVARGNK
ncbi:MAG TPA: long-chain fatty acid--CoA ligase, partial [Kofleriaceae bacterium]